MFANGSPHNPVTPAPIYWAYEAIIYLGLDRLGLARPDMALQRLIKKDALRPKKIGGRLAFDKDELDRVVKHGDQVSRRGRPRRNRLAFCGDSAAAK